MAPRLGCPSESSQRHQHQAAALLSSTSTVLVSALTKPRPRITQPGVRGPRADDNDSKTLNMTLRLCLPGGNLEQMRGRMEQGARRGYVTAAIDCRYHGRRCPPGEPYRDCYENALVRHVLQFMTKGCLRLILGLHNQASKLCKISG